MNIQPFRYSMLCPMFAALVACGGDETTAPPLAEEDPAADACEHLDGGPFHDVTAGTDDASAPAVDASHTSHHITLVDDGAGSFIGQVSLAANEAAEILLFFDAPVPLEVRDSTGAELALEQPAECPGEGCEPGCALVKQHAAVDIESVGTYFLVLGPTSETEVALVHFEAGGHHHEGEH